MLKTAVLVVLAALLAGCVDPAKVAEEEALKGVKFEYDAGYSRAVSADLVVEGRYLSPERVDLYYSYFKGGRYKNPFTSGFLVFSLSLENKGAGRLSFDPRMALLFSSSGGQPMSSLDFTSLYAEFGLAGVDDQAGRMEAYRESCFDSQVSIAPGEKVQRLIVFTRDKDMDLDKGAALQLEGIYMGHTPRSLKLVFKELS